jgi:hypothetical protein
MTKRNPLPLWIVVSIFLAAVTAVALTCRLWSRPAMPTPTATELCTLTGLAEALSQDALDLQVVPMMKNGSPEFGFYLCTDARSWEQLAPVLRRNRDAHQWNGVVYCERNNGHSSSIPEREIQLWGEHAMQIGPFLFFGDPDLLRRIDKIIRNHAKG